MCILDVDCVVCFNVSMGLVYPFKLVGLRYLYAALIYFCV